MYASEDTHAPISSKHYVEVLMIDLHNYPHRKRDISAAEPIFAFIWVLRGKTEVGFGTTEWEDDIHILPMFWFQTVRESEGAHEVC